GSNRRAPGRTARLAAVLAVATMAPLGPALSRAQEVAPVPAPPIPPPSPPAEAPGTAVVGGPAVTTGPLLPADVQVVPFRRPGGPGGRGARADPRAGPGRRRPGDRHGRPEGRRPLPTAALEPARAAGRGAVPGHRGRRPPAPAGRDRPGQVPDPRRLHAGRP